MGVAKNTMKIGVSEIFVVEREEKKAKKDNWNFWFWVFWSKNGRFVTHNRFSKNRSLKPQFHSILGRAFWTKLSKGKFWAPPKK